MSGPWLLERSRPRWSTPAGRWPRTSRVPSLMANAKYEGKYPLVSALSRPVIVPVTWWPRPGRHDAHAVAHGCTGKGNDQVRFEVGTRALAPDLEVPGPGPGVGPEPGRLHRVRRHLGYPPLSVTKEKPYSIDENLWGKAIECGVIEDPWNQPPEGSICSETGEQSVGHPRWPRNREGLRSRLRSRSWSGPGIQAKLNERPRECLNFLTPAEVQANCPLQSSHSRPLHL